MEITIAELVRNGTLSAEMAATLWAAVDERRSFLTVALPRFAGKSTLSNAVLALRPPAVPLQYVDGAPELMERLRRERRGGYLVVAEFSRAPVPGYIWGEPVRRVFETLPAGYALQASMHANGIEEALRLLADGNGLGDEHVSALDLALYIERFGDAHDNYWRRVAHVYEIDRVEGGRPVGRTLYRWDAERDRFDAPGAPRGFARDRAETEARAALLEELARAGRTSEREVAEAVAAFRAGRGSA